MVPGTSVVVAGFIVRAFMGLSVLLHSRKLYTIVKVALLPLEIHIGDTTLYTVRKIEVGLYYICVLARPFQHSGSLCLQ